MMVIIDFYVFCFNRLRIFFSFIVAAVFILLINVAVFFVVCDRLGFLSSFILMLFWGVSGIGVKVVV